MDAIEDTQLAIEAYNALPWGSDEGEHYLYTYGLFQALYVQQDALSVICNKFGLPIVVQRNPILGPVRNIRNQTVGHPMSAKNWDIQQVGWHYIHRGELLKDSMILFSNYPTGGGTRRIETSKLIVDQNQEVANVLSSVITHMEQRFKDLLSDRIA